MKIQKELRYAILSGILIGTSYIPFPPWAAFFCLTPLWLQWLNIDSVKKIFWLGWITQFLLAIIGFHWIPGAIVDYGHLPTPIGYLGLFAFGALTNLHIPLAGVLYFYVNKRWNFSKSTGVFFIALCTALLEKLNPQIFPWHFGYTWYYGEFPAYHISELIGFSGISSLNYIINAWILVIYLNLKDRPTFQKHLKAFILFFAFINAFGFALSLRWNNTDSTAKALIVQPNIGNQEKQWEIYGRAYKSKTVDKHFEMTNVHIAEKPDFVIWPETSIPEFLNKEYYSYPSTKRIFDYAAQIKTHIVTGAYTHTPQFDKQSNSIFVIGPEGKENDFYRKNVLLPFGEYIPFGEYFPSIYKYLPTIGNFERGRGPHSIQVGDLKIGPQICYEGLHPWFSAGLVRDGSQIIVNVTNDSWFGHTFESYQHLYMTLARAIEFRRPMIRATNTGISAVVTAKGDILVLSPQKQSWAQVIEVPYLKNAPRTLYSYFVYIDLVLVVLGLIILIKPKNGIFKKSGLARNP